MNQMVMKNPFFDKVISHSQEGRHYTEFPAIQGLANKNSRRDILPQTRKRPALLPEPGRFATQSKINAWSIADAYALYADPLSYAQLHERHG